MGTCKSVSSNQILEPVNKAVKNQESGPKASSTSETKGVAHLYSNKGPNNATKKSNKLEFNLSIVVVPNDPQVCKISRKTSEESSGTTEGSNTGKIPLFASKFLKNGPPAIQKAALSKKEINRQNFYQKEGDGVVHVVPRLHQLLEESSIMKRRNGTLENSEKYIRLNLFGESADSKNGLNSTSTRKFSAKF